MLRRAAAAAAPARRAPRARASLAAARRPLSVVNTRAFTPEEDERREAAEAAQRLREERERQERRERRRRRKGGFFKRSARAVVLAGAAAATYAAYLDRHVAQPEDGLTWQRLFVETMPTRALSRAWGAVHEVTLPVALREPLYRLWTWKFGCKLDEADQPLEEYPNLQSFFTRRLKEGSRQIQSAELVSSADSHLLACGEVAPGGMIEQVKGAAYDVETLLTRAPPAPRKGNKQFYAVLYLAPGDYHHFHSPCDMVVREAAHVAGEMMPVAPELVRLVPGLYSLNERVALLGEWAHGAMAVVPVAAYNVGNITVAFDGSIRTNARRHDAAVRERKAMLFRDVLPQSGREAVEQVSAHVARVRDTVRSWWTTARGGAAERPTPPSYLARREYPEGVVVRKGDDLGCFHLGSTIVLVFEAPEAFKFRADAGFDVLMGQNLGSVSK